jgi:DNA repair exonuclease SbcCD ATPase subunit
LLQYLKVILINEFSRAFHNRIALQFIKDNILFHFDFCGSKFINLKVLRIFLHFLFAVIYEYKLQLEKTLSNEKSANAAAKEELQKKASRERSLRDKDIIEAMQRFNSLQQNYKLLQTEHQDLKDDCKKKETVALEDSKRLESTLQDLRIQLKKAGESKEKSMEHLKTKYMELINQKEQLEENYNNLKKISGANNGNVEHLEKQIIQLQRELEDVKVSVP